MSDVATQETTALTLIPKSALPTILAMDGAADILSGLADKISAFKPDISTPKGRREIASLADQVASAKMDIVRLANKTTETWRESTKLVVGERKALEERMDALKAQVRKPLDAFLQIEKDRIAGHEAALARLAVDPAMEHESIEILSAAIQWRLEPEARNWQEFHQPALAAHAAAIATLSKWRDAAQQREEAAEEARQAAETERQEREARIASEAADRARRAAEAEAAAAKAASERRERDAQEAASRAVAEREAAAERHKLELAASAAKASADREAAIEAERVRVAAEAEAKRREDEKRAANIAHRTRVNREALAPLVAIGLTEEMSKAVIVAIAKGEIPHVRIEY